MGCIGCVTSSLRIGKKFKNDQIVDMLFLKTKILFLSFLNLLI